MPNGIPPAVLRDRPKIQEMRKGGMSLGRIAKKLRMSKTTVARIVS